MKLNNKESINLDRSGFTLIELMVVVAILGLIILGTVTFFSGGIRAWISGQYQLQAQREARSALDRMVKEIREGDTFGNSSDSNTIIVHYNVLSKDDRTYSWSGSSGDSLRQKIGDGLPEPFLDNVHSLTFIYLDRNGIEMTNPSNASKIVINLQLDLDGDAITGGNPDIILDTDVNLRNYGF